MKKVFSSFIAIALLAMPLSAYGDQCCEPPFDEECCLPSALPPPKNCSDAEEHAIGKSMMGWGLAIIAAIAIVAGTVDQSTGN